jgi:hypothetical protein
MSDLSAEQKSEEAVDLGRRVLSAYISGQSEWIHTQTKEYYDRPEILEGALIYATSLLGTLMGSILDKPEDEWQEYMMKEYRRINNV